MASLKDFPKIWAKVQVDEETSCHNWLGALESRGNPIMLIGKRLRPELPFAPKTMSKSGNYRPYKLAYLLHHELTEDDVDGVFVKTCGNHRCVNPEHIRMTKTGGDNWTEVTHSYKTE